jgi:transposase
MYYIGIDASKFKHDCSIIEDNNLIELKRFTFSCTHEGFQFFLRELNTLDSKQEYKIGLEATGHYHQTLMNLLINNEYHFAEFNPLIISRLAEAFSLRRTKTDSVDAKFITSILKVVDYKTYQVNYDMYQLKKLTRMRSQLIKNRSKYLVQITNILDIIFPEYKGFFSDTNDFTKTSLYILEKYPTVEKMKTIDLECFETIRKLSRGSFNLSKYYKFMHLVNNTIGYSDSYSELELITFIALYNFLNGKIDIIKNEIISLITIIDPPTLSIPGVGPLSAAVILAEYNNISKFDNPGQMLAFAGIEPSISESGTQSHTGHMVKHGSGYLRQTLMNLVNPLNLHNPVISAYYYKKRNEGKVHRVASTHVVRKLLRYIFYLETHNIRYDPSLAK